jgi:hypothetical protein
MSDDILLEVLLDKRNEQKKPVERKSKREMRIEGAEIGSMVAFKDFDGSVHSAKLTAKNVSQRVLKLQARGGITLAVEFDDVVWVKDKYWPKFVFAAFKGITLEEFEKQQADRKAKKWQEHIQKKKQEEAASDATNAG